MRESGYTGSDLACESAEAWTCTEGTEHSERRVGEIRIECLRVQSEEAAECLHKPVGTYVTFHCGSIDRLSAEQGETLARLLAGELSGMAQKLTKKANGSELGVFVAGLGNAELTADAVGPKTVSRLTATRHLRDHDGVLFERVGCAAISALAPGVLGQTGIETAELVHGAVRFVRPDVVVVIDALAARSCERLATTVQICDAGIAPGSGVGNCRRAIDRASLGVPVIALGVPTVVGSSTLVYDALRQAGIDTVSEELERVLENGKGFFVSPKECDVICDRISRLLARAISLAFAGALAAEE